MFLLTICLISLQILCVHPKSDCKVRLAKCDSNATVRSKPVCGNDNNTYPSRCALLRVQCHQDSNIAVKHRGRCRDRQPCWAEQQGLRKTKSPAGEVFMPSCLPDGRYAGVQCHDATGYCWCVTATGTPIPNTSVRHGRPKCPQRGKMKQGVSKKEGDENKSCKKDERLLLMQNIVRIFRTEFYKVQPKQELDTEELSPEEQAVSWKFSQLDLDASGNLTLPEFDQVQKLIRKVVKPKKCSRVFVQLCDEDKDVTLTRDEWTHCLALPKNKRQKNPMRNKERIEPVIDDLEDLDSTDTEEENIPLEVLQDGASHRSLIVDDIYRSRDEPEVNDCLSDRKAVLDEQKFSATPNSLDKMYVPECTLDGRYKRVQCYNSTGYCWCVEEDTGKPIPGTSVKDSNPKCDIALAPVRPMKGCPGNKKREFLKNLMEYFTNTMLSQKNVTNNTQEDGRASAAGAGDEQVATWNFGQLDVDKNKVLEQQEWKSFRSTMSSVKSLRRCGKKLPRHCDANNDRKISLSEWLNCLNVNTNRANRSTSEFPSKPSSAAAESVAPEETVSPTRRRGPSPLEILKGDDD
uniref:SPARC-related modular calcium-binding protein 1 n=2 Tax=Cacopsylla melanoneura TaxID=428564 RepID=A0A8D8PQ46_9HEMI